MDIWVKDMRTGEKWILDDDPSKKVYKTRGGSKLHFELQDISYFRFYPCDPDHEAEFREERCKEIERNSEGYQFNIFDFKEITNDTMA